MILDRFPHDGNLLGRKPAKQVIVLGQYLSAGQVVGFASQGDADVMISCDSINHIGHYIIALGQLHTVFDYRPDMGDVMGWIKALVGGKKRIGQIVDKIGGDRLVRHRIPPLIRIFPIIPHGRAQGNSIPGRRPGMKKVCHFLNKMVKSMTGELEGSAKMSKR